jgi:hypothetical protein
MFQNPLVTLFITNFNVQKFYILPTQYIHMFSLDPGKRSDYSRMQHESNGLYNRQQRCLLRGKS